MTAEELDYRIHVASWLECALEKPSMYFQDLEHLESMMVGNAVAFEYLTGQLREQSFNTCFRNWVHDHKGLSVSGGWAYAISTSPAANQSDELAVFHEWVNEFFAEWIPSAD